MFPELELLCLTADTVTHAAELAKHCITSTSLLIQACPGLENKLSLNPEKIFILKASMMFYVLESFIFDLLLFT